MALALVAICIVVLLAAVLVTGARDLFARHTVTPEALGACPRIAKITAL
jgi:hypothetical protein